MCGHIFLKEDTQGKDFIELLRECENLFHCSWMDREVSSADEAAPVCLVYKAPQPAAKLQQEVLEPGQILQDQFSLSNISFT